MNKLWSGVGATLGLTALVIGLSGNANKERNDGNEVLSLGEIREMTITGFNALLSGRTKERSQMKNAKLCMLSYLQNEQRMKGIISCDGIEIVSQELGGESPTRGVIQIKDVKPDSNGFFDPLHGCLVIEGNGKEVADPPNCNQEDNEQFIPLQKKGNIKA